MGWPLLRRVSTFGALLALPAGLLIEHSRAVVLAASTPARVRVTRSFDADWRFLKADAPGAETVDFDDAAWRKLDVPHDWSIEGPFDKDDKTGGAEHARTT